MTGIPRFEAYEEDLRGEYGTPNENVFTVSGLTGTGTTTIAQFLAEQWDMNRITAGDFFREQAASFGMDIQEFDEKTTAIEEEQDRDFDIEWDRTALRYAFTRDNFVLEGRLAGVVLHDIAPVRVYVTCDEDVVAERIMDREDLSFTEAKKHVTVRNREVLERYQEKYGINPRSPEFYNIRVDNSGSFSAVKAELLRQVQQLTSS